VTSQPAEIKERAVMQLSQKIASVYDQYLVYRPGMLRNWQRAGTAEDPDGKWQAELWNLLEKRRHIHEKGHGFPNKAVLIKETNQALKMGDIQADHRLLFFNTGLLPLPVLHMAGNAAKSQGLILYQTAVTEKMGGDRTNSLLNAFGVETAGVDMLLDSLEGEVFDDFSIRNSADNTLQSIQESIILDRDIKPNKSEDISRIEIHSCHSPLREIEVLHQFLLRQLEKDPELHPDDILIVMPDIDRYKPVVHAVFGTQQEGVPSIPYHVDFRRSGSETMVRPFLQILELADSRFQFSDVMDLFLEPLVHSSFDISETGARRLKRWMEENNVIWGLNGAHRSSEGQPDVSYQTWQSALTRGWSGIVHGEQTDPFANGTTLRFSDIQGQDMEEIWAGFSNLMSHFQSLNGRVKANRSPDSWCQLMEDEIDYFFSDNSQNRDQESYIQSVLDTIRDESSAAGFNREISFSMFRSHLRSLLDQQSASPAHFTRGVTFSSMVPVRSIPAKIVALIGLNESEFPRKVKNIDFDLMARNPKPYERNPKNQDRSLFLETILAGKSFHYCSYIGRSQTDNEVIPPSPIVSEWMTTLSTISGKEVKEILIEEPLHGFSADNFRLNRSYSKTGYQTANKLYHAKGRHPGLSADTDLPQKEGSNILLFNDLIRFISNPLKSYLKTYFNPFLNDPEELKYEFDLNPLEEHNLFERIFGWRLKDHTEKDISVLLSGSGILPGGWQGETVVQNLIQSVDIAIQSARERGFNPSVSNMDFTLDLDDKRVSGELLSYSTEQFLEITPSSESGDKFLRSWMKHLAGQCTDLFPVKESLFLCNLKKGKPKLYIFNPVEKPEAELNRYLSIFNRGMSQPLYLFPNALYEYQNEFQKNSDKAFSKARSTFEGSDYSPYAENRDRYATLMLGENAAFREEYLDSDMLAAIQLMLDHREELK
jgi:exodeoxyribonuclease V gamma subunit